MLEVTEDMAETLNSRLLTRVAQAPQQVAWLRAEVARASIVDEEKSIEAVGLRRIAEHCLAPCLLLWRRGHATPLAQSRRGLLGRPCLPVSPGSPGHPWRLMPSRWSMVQMPLGFV